jgi:UDP-glucose 4-epimerase
MKILITGISGTLARGVAYRLVRRGHEVIGIDRRPWPDVPEGVEMHQVDIRKRPAEDVFRISRPDALIHMATVTHFTTDTEERYRINLGGTRKLFEYCHEYGVKQAVFVGRHTVYGATPDSPLYHTEDEPPLAGAAFKELADLVAADLYAGSALWRLPELNTAVLRLCYFLGPSHGGTLAGFLSKNRVPLVLGFDPLYQLMHEWDAEEAITLAVEKQLRGVFNVAGPSPVPLTTVCEATGRRAVPIPEPLYPAVLGRFGFPYLPDDAIVHVKYPIVIDNKAFVEATGFEPRYSAKQTMEGFRWN